MTQRILLQIARGNFLYLLFSLLLLLLLAPFFEKTFFGSIMVDAAYSAVLLSAVYAVSEKKRLYILSVIFVIPLIGMRWANHLLQNDAFALLIKILTLMFFAFTTCSIFAHVLKDEAVTANKICGALSVYLLIGVTWALLFALLERMQPQSFALADVLGASNRGPTLFIYYSFVTLTTLGYGDIVPLTPIARAFSFVEAICGQIYLAVLIARLVGLHIIHAAGNQATSQGGNWLPKN